MDPITAINLEFAREVEEDWSREPAADLAKQTTRAARPSLADRLRVAVGERLIAIGMWLKTSPQPIRVDK